MLLIYLTYLKYAGTTTNIILVRSQGILSIFVCFLTVNTPIFPYLGGQEKGRFLSFEVENTRPKIVFSIMEVGLYSLPISG